MGIEIRDISKRYGDFRALTDIELDVPSGGLTALLGPSGSGKTTLLRILGGQETPDTGTVHIDGHDVTHTPARHRNIGFVFQHYAAFKHMSVAKNVAFGLEIRKKPRAEVSRRVTELLELVQLVPFKDRMPSQLSGGQRQRMALARALAIDPSVLLLDEPFGALDAKVRKELREWLRQLHDDVDLTSVFVTHDQEEALEVADTIVVINEGRIEQIGTPEEIYDRPATDFVFHFIGEATRLGESLLRPHDVVVRPQGEADGLPGVISRWNRVGFEVRLEITLDQPVQPDPVRVHLTRTEAKNLNLEPESRVTVSPRFDANLRAVSPETSQSTDNTVLHNN
ncbi:sulfate/molybdate ABC transporter ATP-binding protein [Auritidibacter ignavus]|uniref:sulfate/molybdate ABC transporter ATP-binding protein n=1 Tax=Auritidibacter ignavus TaxID=678932 RepID=UPI00109D6E2A|nr:TOBE-like domain-containing protein [Auritidibacter ignavus]